MPLVMFISLTVACANCYDDLHRPSLQKYECIACSVITRVSYFMISTSGVSSEVHLDVTSLQT